MQATQVLIEEAAVAEFSATFSGAVVRPGDEGYDAARAVFNDHLTDVSVEKGVLISAVLALVAVALVVRSFGRALA